MSKNVKQDINSMGLQSFPMGNTPPVNNIQPPIDSILQPINNIPSGQSIQPSHATPPMMPQGSINKIPNNRSIVTGINKHYINDISNKNYSKCVRLTSCNSLSDIVNNSPLDIDLGLVDELKRTIIDNIELMLVMYDKDILLYLDYTLLYKSNYVTHAESIIQPLSNLKIEIRYDREEGYSIMVNDEVTFQKRYK